MSRPLLEFGGGSGEILRDLLHLRSVSEVEALISGAEGRDQLQHISISCQAPEPLGRFEDAGGDPAQHHLAAPPALHVAFDVAGLSNRNAQDNGDLEVHRADVGCPWLARAINTQYLGRFYY